MSLDDLREFDVRRVEALRCAAQAEWPHPFEWMGLLERPRFVWFRPRLSIQARRAHQRLVLIFAEHGFALTPRVAERFRLADAQRYDEDCGGAVHRRLMTALHGQLHLNS